MGNDYRQRVKLVAPALLAIAALSVAVPLALLTIDREYLDSIELSLFVYEYGLPLATSGIGVFALLDKRTRFIAEERIREGMLMLAWAVLAIPTCASVVTLSRLIDPLQSVSIVAEIDPVSPERYYDIERVVPDFDVGGVADTIKPYGNNESELRVTYYIVIPLVVDGSVYPATHPYWHGFEFSRVVSRSLSDAAIDAKFQRFYKRSVQDVLEYDFASADYLEVVQPSEALHRYRDATAFAGLPPEAPAVVLVARQGEFGDRADTPKLFLLWSVIVGWPLYFVVLAFPGVDPEALRQLEQGDPDPDAEPWTESFLAMLFVPTNENWFTPIVSLVIVGVYVAMLYAGVDWMSPTVEDVLAWGGNSRAYTIGQGEYWRLLTNVFVHYGIQHVIFNVMGILLIAFFASTVYHQGFQFTVFLLSGLCGSLASVLVQDSVVSAGASGAFFGLFGALAALSLKRIVPWWEFTPLYVFAGCMLLLGLFPGIDNLAHVGGLLCGLVMGLCYRLPEETLEMIAENRRNSGLDTDSDSEES